MMYISSFVRFTKENAGNVRYSRFLVGGRGKKVERVREGEHVTALCFCFHSPSFAVSLSLSLSRFIRCHVVYAAEARWSSRPFVILATGLLRASPDKQMRCTDCTRVLRPCSAETRLSDDTKFQPNKYASLDCSFSQPDEKKSRRLPGGEEKDMRVRLTAKRKEE